MAKKGRTSFKDRVRKAVDDVLSTHEWPIFQMQDDRGLDRDEYVEFVIAVANKARLR